MHSALMVYGTLMVFVTLNLFLILASSLLILLTSASLLLQFLMSEIKTANPENIRKLLRFVRSFLKCPFLDRSSLWILHLYINLACLSVCLDPINVKTAEPIGPKFFVGHHVSPGKVYE